MAPIVLMTFNQLAEKKWQYGWLVVTLLAVLVNAGILRGLANWEMPAFLRFAILLSQFLALLIVPGWQLTHLLNICIDPSQRVPLAFLCSMGIFTPVALIGLTLQTSITAVQIGCALLTLIVGILFLFRAQPETQPQLPKKIYWGLIVTILCTLGFAANFHNLRDFGDDWFYLHFIQQYLTVDLNTSLNPIIDGSVAGGSQLRASLNGWWVLIAMLTQPVANQLLPAYFLHLPLLLQAIALLATFTLANALLKKPTWALIAVWIQLLYLLTSIGSFDWPGQAFFVRINEDKFMVWHLLLPSSIYLFFRFTQVHNWSNLALLLLAFVALGLTHPLAPFQLGLAIAAWIAWQLGTKLAEKGWLGRSLVALLLLLATVDSIWQRLLQSGTVQPAFLLTNPLFEPPGDTHLIMLNQLSDRFLLHPHGIMHPLSLLAMGMALWMWWQHREGAAAQFIVAITLLPLLLLFNPVTLPWLAHWLEPTLLWRLVWVMPTSILLTFGLRRAASGLKPLRHPLVTSLLGLVVLLLGLRLLIPYFEDGVRALRDIRRRSMTVAELALLAEMPAFIPPNSTILAPPAIDTHLPAFLPSVNLFTFRGFLAEPEIDVKVDQLLRSSQLSQESTQFLEQWQIDFLLVRDVDELSDGLTEMPAFFQPILQKEPLTLYKIKQLPDRAQLPETVAPSPRQTDVKTSTLLQSPHRPSFPPKLWHIWGHSNAFDREIEQAVLSYLDSGDRLARVGDFLAAEAAFKEAILLQPRQQQAYKKLAELFQSQQMSKRELALWQHAARTNFNLPWPHLELGNYYETQNNAAAAIQQYQRVLQLDAASEEAHIRLGHLFVEQDDIEAAITLYQRAQARYSWWSLPYLELGELYMMQGDSGAAIAWWLAGLESFRPPQTLFQQLANWHLSQSDYSAALSVYETAQSQYPDRAWPWFEAAQVLANRGDLAGAEAQYQTAFSKEPPSPDQLFLAGNMIRNELQSSASAIPYYERAISLDPAREDIAIILAVALFEVGELDAGISTFTAATQSNPASADIYLHIGAILNQAGLWGKAAAHYERAVEAEIINDQILLQLGDAHLNDGNLVRAIAIYEQGATRFPQIDIFHERLSEYAPAE